MVGLVRRSSLRGVGRDICAVVPALGGYGLTAAPGSVCGNAEDLRPMKDELIHPLHAYLLSQLPAPPPHFPRLPSL